MGLVERENARVLRGHNYKLLSDAVCRGSLSRLDDSRSIGTVRGRTLTTTVICISAGCFNNFCCLCSQRSRPTESASRCVPTECGALCVFGRHSSSSDVVAPTSKPNDSFEGRVNPSKPNDSVSINELVSREGVILPVIIFPIGSVRIAVGQKVIPVSQTGEMKVSGGSVIGNLTQIVS